MHSSLKQKLVVFVIFGIVAQFFLTAYVLVQSYEGRVSLVSAQRDGCDRGKLDRKSIALINNSVTQGFADTDSRNPEPISEERMKAETDLKNDLPGLLDRASINCNEVFPSASFSPTRGAITP